MNGWMDGINNITTACDAVTALVKEMSYMYICEVKIWLNILYT